MTFVTLMMQHVASGKVPESVITPQIGETQCFLQTGLPELYYFHIINAPVLVSHPIPFHHFYTNLIHFQFANFVFFSLFICELMCDTWSVHKRDELDETGKYSHKTRMKVVTKIFFVLGLTWVAEIVSWICHYTYSVRLVYKIVLFFDLVNALQVHKKLPI